MNTKISYMYRDASNYKSHNEVVLEGVITEKQISQIIPCLDAGEYFIPRQVGLPERRFADSPTDDDHSWFELFEDGFELTWANPTVSMTVDELVKKFEAAKDNWVIHTDYPHCYPA